MGGPGSGPRKGGGRGRKITTRKVSVKGKRGGGKSMSLSGLKKAAMASYKKGKAVSSRVMSGLNKAVKKGKISSEIFAQIKAYNVTKGVGRRPRSHILTT